LTTANRQLQARNGEKKHNNNNNNNITAPLQEPITESTQPEKSKVKENNIHT
jgi:hypothetical protein